MAATIGTWFLLLSGGRNGESDHTAGAPGWDLTVCVWGEKKKKKKEEEEERTERRRLREEGDGEKEIKCSGVSM